VRSSTASDEKRRRLCPGLAFLLCLTCVGASGQNESMARCFRGPNEPLLLSSSNNDPWTIRTRVTEVTLFFTATERHRFVPELAPEDVHVTEDGQPVARIWAFRRQRDLPFRLGLLIDTSGSVNPRFRFEKESAIQFLRRMVRRDVDLAFVMGFSDHTHLTRDFSDDVDSLAHGVTALENRGGTALFDAIQKASDKLAAVPDEQPVARVLIILSDGEDNASQGTFKKALDRAARKDVTIYTINTRVDSADPRYAYATPEGDAVLKRLAEQTGGRFFSRMSANRVANAFTAIEEEMRNRFALSYRPTDLTEDGRFHRIHITAERSGHRLRVQARKGYYARLTPFTE
jgi:Ca-activated chloride channel family protein